MKKFFVCLLILLIPFCFIGCGNTDIVTQASNGANSYKITATLNEQEHSLSAIEIFDYQNTSDSIQDYLMFHLHPNAFKEGNNVNYAISASQESRAYNDTKSYGNIDINSVKQGNNVLSYTIEGADSHLLKVQLDGELQKGDIIEISIDFSLQIPNVNHRFGYGDNTINLGNWYPVICMFENGEWDTDGYLPSGDPFYTDIANYDVTINYSKNLVMVSTGELLYSEEKVDIITANYKALAVRDFAMVFSDKFEVKSQQVGDVTVNYYYFDDDKSDEHLRTGVDALLTFNELIGDYPYKVLNIVKNDFLHGGMEYPNLVYISDQVTNDSEYNNVIIHEIAHQWWYGVVGNDQLAYGWIDEGLAEYSTALFYDLNDGYAYTKNEVIGNALSSYLLFCDVYKEVYDNLDTSINRSVSTFNTETEYVYVTYVKGMLMFDSIADSIGQKKMNKCLKTLYREYSMNEVTPTKLIDCFEKASGRKLRSFITSWLDGSVILEELNG